jgi:hypothetical protein
MENFQLAPYFSEYSGLLRLPAVFTHILLPKYVKIAAPRKISDCFPCYVG